MQILHIDQEDLSEVDSKNGNVLDKKIKKKFWSREYEKGWDLSFV